MANKARTITPEARATATKVRSQRSVFNKYLGVLGKGCASCTRLEDVEAALAGGTRRKKVPVFENKVRAGSVEKDVPLLPADRLRLLQKRNALLAKQGKKGPSTDLRDKFIEILPDYAEHHGYDRDILLSVGVPEEDLDAAGII